MSDDNGLEPIRKVNRELKSLRRLPQKGMVGGVCAGLAYRIGMPTWLLRLSLALLVLLKGVGVGIYLLLWIFLPRQDATPTDYRDRTGG